MSEKYTNLSIFQLGTFSPLLPGKERLNLRSRDEKHSVFKNMAGVLRFFQGKTFLAFFCFYLLLCDFFLYYHFIRVLNTTCTVSTYSMYSELLKSRARTIDEIDS